MDPFQEINSHMYPWKMFSPVKNIDSKNLIIIKSLNFLGHKNQGAKIAWIAVLDHLKDNFVVVVGVQIKEGSLLDQLKSILT